MLNTRKNSYAAKVVAVFLSSILFLSEGSASNLTLCEISNSFIAGESGFKSFFNQDNPPLRKVSPLSYALEKTMALLKEGDLRESHIKRFNDLFLEGEIKFVYGTEDFQENRRREGKTYEVVHVFSEENVELMKIVFFKKSDFPASSSLKDIGVDVSDSSIRYFDLPLGRMYIVLSREKFKNKDWETIFDMTITNLFGESTTEFPEVADELTSKAVVSTEENIGVSGLKRTAVEFMTLSFLFQFVGVLTFISHNYFLFSVFAVLPCTYCVLHAFLSFNVMRYVYETGKTEGIASTVTVELFPGKTVKMIREASEFHTLPRFMKFLIRGHELTHVLGFGDVLAYRFPFLGYFFGLFVEKKTDKTLNFYQKKFEQIRRGLKEKNTNVVKSALWEAMGLNDKRIVPYLAEVLYHHDSEVKGLALKVIGRKGDKRVFPALLDKLSDSSSAVRKASALVLKQMNVGRDDILKALAKGMCSDIVDVRNFSLINLESMKALKEDNFVFWCVALREEDSELRKGVLEILDRMKGIKSIADRLENEYLSDERKDVRIAAVLILAELKRTESLSRLLDVSQRDSDSEVRYYSRKAVTRIDSDFPVVLSKICSRLRNNDIRKRKQVMIELEQIKSGKDILEFWKWAANAEDKNLKIASALVLAELRPVDTAHILIPLTNDYDDDVERYAKEALRRWSPEIEEMVPIWCEELRSEDPACRAEAMGHIEKLNAIKEHTQYWRKSLKGRRKELIIAAMLLLTEMGDEDSFPDILRLTMSRDKDIRQYARIALKRMAPNRKEMVPIWCEELRSEDPACRAEAMEYLEKLNAGKCQIDYWRRCLKDQRKELRIAALFVLAELKDTASISAMKKMKASSDREIRRFARVAVKRGFGDGLLNHAVEVADKIHRADLKLIPTIPQRRIICHIIDDSLVIPEQKKILYALHKTTRNVGYSEKIVRVSGDDGSDFITNLEIERQKQKELYPGYDIEFSIACRGTETLTKILDRDSDAKVIAFESSSEAVQVEGIILALRALYSSPEKVLVNLHKVYEFLSGRKLSEIDMKIRDIREFLKKKAFVLPPVRLIDHNEIARLNKLIYENIRTAV